MKYLYESMKTEALLALKTALHKIYTPAMEDFVLPPNSEFGDLAFPCFKLAKGMRKPAHEISRELAPKIHPKGLIREVVAEGPYINFRFSTDAVLQCLRRETLNLKEKYGQAKIHRRRIMVEYSGLNTHKTVHIGHARNISFGAALVRLFRAVGYQVVAADFVNDLGLHVAQCLWAYEKFHRAQEPKENPGKFLGQVYVEAATRYAESEEAKHEIMKYLGRLDNRDLLLNRLWKKTRKWSLAEFAAVHKDLGARFDVFYAESDFVKERLQKVEELLKKGIAVKSQGAVIVNLEDVGLGVFVILRSDGTALYATTDLALLARKFKDYKKLDRSINITDSRQKQHFAQLFETFRRLDYQQEFQHVAYEFVTLPEGAMSSRKGTVVSYEEVRDEVMSRAEEETKKRHPDWSKNKIYGVASAIALSAIVFDMIKQDPDKPIVFDTEEALALSGFSSSYLQYTTARIAGILRKVKPPGRKVTARPVTNKLEHRLIMGLSRYPDIVREAAEKQRPSLLAHYLFSTARDFATFYDAVPVLTAPPGDQASHLAVLKIAQAVFRNGLELLGVQALDEM